MPKVDNVHWILVEDADECGTTATGTVLASADAAGISTASNTILAAKMPGVFTRKPKSMSLMRRLPLPRGVAGRRAALKFLQENTK